MSFTPMRQIRVLIIEMKFNCLTADSSWLSAQNEWLTMNRKFCQLDTGSPKLGAESV